VVGRWWLEKILEVIPSRIVRRGSGIGFPIAGYARATIGRQTRFVVASEETCAQWSRVTRSIAPTTAVYR